MPGYLINKVSFSAPPTSGNQFVSVFHKVSTAPDADYVTDGTHVEVYPNGILVTPFQISGLAYDTDYAIKVSNDCGGGHDIIIISIGAAPCPDVTGFAGTPAPYNAIVLFNVNAAAFGTFNGPVQDNNLQIIATSTA